MFLEIKALCTLFFYASISLAQQPSSTSLPLEDFYLMEAVDVRTSEEDPAQSFVGKPFDEEISQEQLNKSQTKDVSELLNQIPGAENMGGPRKEAQGISIRGFQPNQVLLLLDGTRSNFSMTHNSIIPVRPHLLKKVDVLKGGASSRFGNGALGGMVSFSTMTAHDFVELGQTQKAEFRSQYSDASVSYQNSVTAASLMGKQNRWGLIADFTETTAKDIQLSNDEALAYSAFEDESVWAKSSWLGPSGHTVWFSAEEQTKDSVTPMNPTQNDEDVSEIADQQELYRSYKLHYEKKGSGRFRPEALIYHSTTEMDRQRIEDLRRDERNVKTSGVSLHSQVDIVRPTQGSDWGLMLQPGAEVFRDDNLGSRNGAELGSFPDGRAEHVGAYVLADLTLAETYWLHTGVRYDEEHLITSDPELENRINKAWSPEVEVGTSVTENLEISVSYEEGYNAPRIQDIYVDGYHFGGFFGGDNFFVPNEDLQPENSQTTEVRVAYSYGTADYGGKLTWAEFESVVDNYIEQDINLSENTTRFVNVPQVKLQGRELEWRQSIEQIQLGLSYARVRSLKTANGQPLSTSPADQIRALVSYEKAQWFWGFENILYRVQDRTDQTVLSFSNTTTPSANVQNALFGYHWKRSTYSGSTRFRLNNIFDIEYQKHGSPLKESARDLRLELVLSI